MERWEGIFMNGGLTSIIQIPQVFWLGFDENSSFNIEHKVDGADNNFNEKDLELIRGWRKAKYK